MATAPKSRLRYWTEWALIVLTLGSLGVIYLVVMWLFLNFVADVLL